jgi:hypothetical protein
MNATDNFNPPTKTCFMKEKVPSEQGAILIKKATGKFKNVTKAT